MINPRTQAFIEKLMPCPCKKIPDAFQNPIQFNKVGSYISPEGLKTFDTNGMLLARDRFRGRSFESTVYYPSGGTITKLTPLS